MNTRAGRREHRERHGDGFQVASGQGKCLALTQVLQCLAALPAGWRKEMFDLGEGQTFERMGQAWFYSPPHDEEDCLWKAAVQNGILHVEFEVDRETCRRKFAIPLAALAEDAAPDITEPGSVDDR